MLLFTGLPGSGISTAISALGKVLLEAATGAAVDAIYDNVMASLDEDGNPAEVPQNPTVTDSTVTVVDPPEQPGVNIQIDIGPVGGPAEAKIGTVAASGQTATQREATEKDMKSIQSTPEGKAALAAVPEAVRNAQPKQENSDKYRQAKPEQQYAASASAQGKGKAVLDKELINAAATTNPHDGSRVSKEYHEWKYCVVQSGDVAILESVASFSLTYVGPDPVGPSNLAPYYKWIQYEDYRKAFWILRRYRRKRGGCGGKALWTDQGFASKDAAIADDLNGDAEYQAIHSTLTATSDFS